MRAIVIHEAGKLTLDEFPQERCGADQVVLEVATGGVCGSDLHYFNHGGFGPVRLREPMVLGHEVAGRVVDAGSAVKGINVGDLVAVSPSRPCGECRFCVENLQNQCLNMRFYGSAMPFPHIQGAFRQRLVADASQCVVANGLSAAEAAMAEPLSVALHAMRRADGVKGKKVLVTGCGPIGVLCILAAREAGAEEIIATDLSANALNHAKMAGADLTIDIRSQPDALETYGGEKGTFEALFECSGSPSALAGAIPALRPRGVIVQLGLGGDMPVPMMQITAKELELRGSFRFHEEFAQAVEKMLSGRIDVKPLITHTVEFDDAQKAFEIANDRDAAMKVQISFSDSSARERITP
ncbi:MAG: L-idonate 5-dehydrogenase [Rhizobiaceae bacterium]